MSNPGPARGLRAQHATGNGGSGDGVYSAPNPAEPATRAPATPVFEPLEGRQLLSSVSLSNGILTLVGNTSSANELVIQPSGSSNLFAYANNVSKTVSKSSVKAVKFTGGSRNDLIFLSTSINVPTTVTGGAGDDDIRLSGGNDVVDAGDGNDRIWTRPGNDKVIGGNGDDEFKGDLGNDTFDGGAGKDYADGGQGDDLILTGDGDDTLIGNLDDDKLDGGNGHDSIRADSGNDTLLGGGGNDTLQGGSGADIFDGGAGTNSYLDPKAEDKVPYGSVHGTPGGGNGTDSGGYTGVGITDNEATITGKSIDSSTPKPVINLIGKTGIGPHTVHVHALSSTLNAGSYLTARYEWDFGDDGSQYNTLVGWNAAHLYEKPGTYTITLRLTNEDGRTNTLSTNITVVEDKRPTIYVDAVAGSDANNGLSERTPVKTANRARELLKSNMRLMFKRGQRHTINKSITLPFHNVLVGAYGSGDRPLLWRVDGEGTSTISTFDKSNQVVIQDLEFDSPHALRGNIANRVYADGIYARGVNITIRGCEFGNLDDAINANGDPRGMLVQNNTAPLATGLRAYFVWSEGSDQVFLGNLSANSTREHNLRSSGTQRMLIAFNKFTNLDRSGVDKLDYSKGTVEVHKGAFAYVANNELHDGALRAGPRGNTYESPANKTEWTVFEANRLYEHDLTIKVGTHHFMARNNIIHSNSSQAMTIDVSDKWGRTVSDIHIVNNTAVTTLDKGRFILLPVSGGNKAAITLKNNMWVTKNYHAGANGSAPVFVYGRNLDMFKEISNNVWPKAAAFHKYGQGGIHYVWTTSSDSRGYLDYREWDAYAQVHDEKYDNSSLDSSLRPRAGTVAATAGVAVNGVFTDFFGRKRPLSGKVSAGAVQA